MKPYYEHAGITIYHGDCHEVVDDGWTIDAVITDPPYGMSYNTNSTRFSLKRGGNKADWGGIAGDDQPFDPSPWLKYPRVILFGCNHFSQRLPVGTTLVWIKRHDEAFGTFLSDAELAWMKGGYGVYCHRGPFPQAIAIDRDHPAQKPEGLMDWCIQKANVPLGGLVLDPFMGSGTTLVSAKRWGRKAIGIELEERYCEIAARRLSQEALPLGEAS